MKNAYIICVVLPFYPFDAKRILWFTKESDSGNPVVLFASD